MSASPPTPDVLLRGSEPPLRENLLNKSGGNRVGSSAIAHWVERLCFALLGWLDARHRYQFRQLVLGGGCEDELIAGTIRSS